MRVNTTASDLGLLELISEGLITADDYGRVLSDQEKSKSLVQPASLDLRVGDRAWLMKGSVRPRENEKVKELISKYAIEEYDLTQGSLEMQKDSVYLCECMESINSSRAFGFHTNTKSSVGRNDVQIRSLVDGNPSYDVFRSPINSRIYNELVPNSFHVSVSRGTALNQIRVSLRDPLISSDELHSISMFGSIIYNKDGSMADRNLSDSKGLLLNLDLNGRYTPDPKIIGYKAKKNLGLRLNLSEVSQRPWEDFFEPIYRPKNGEIILEPGNFYLLSTNEAVGIPDGFAAEVAQFDSQVGHLTTHYAGFIDPGFGIFPDRPKQGNTVTLEMRAHNRPEIIRDKQPVAKINLERLSSKVLVPYGKERGSNYSRQIGVRYSKHLK